MDILEYINRVNTNFDKKPEPRYNMKKYFMGGSVTTPKRGLVDEPGSYAGRYADPDYQKKWYEKNKERVLKDQREKYKALSAEEKTKKAKKSIEFAKTEEGKKYKAEGFKRRKLAKGPLSAVDKKLLNRFKLNLTYSKIVNEIIKDHGGLRPKPEILSQLIDIHYEIDPELQKAWKQVAGDAPFSSKNLSPSALEFNYNRAMGATKKVTADNFKKELEGLIKSELKGTGTTYDEFIENNLRLNETYLTDNYKSKTKGAQYQRRYKKVMQSGVGWNPEGAGAKVFFGDSKLKTSTIPTKLNARLGTKAFDDAGRFVRAHYFGTIQAKKLYDLGLLSEEAALNFKERYTWKPDYINKLQGSTYDADVYKAILKYNKHKDKSLLANDLNVAAKNAKKLGLDIDELVLDNKTKKFNFIDKGRIFQKGGDRELRYLSKNAVKEIANIQFLSGKVLTPAAEADIRQAYGKKANRIIEQIKVGINYNYPNLDKQMFRAVERVDSKELINNFKKMGLRCNKNTGGVEDIQCYLNDFKKTKEDIRSSNPEIRSKAIVKQRNALKQAQKIPQIARALRGAMTGSLKLIGGFPGIVLEGLIEFGAFDYYKQKGYDDKQAAAEGTFFAKKLGLGDLKTGEGRGFLEGAETLLQKELVGGDPAKQKYFDIKDAMDQKASELEMLNKELKSLKSGARGYGKGDDFEIFDKEEEIKQAVEDYNKLANQIKPGTSLYQSYQTGLEKQEAIQAGRIEQERKSSYLTGLPETPMTKENRERNLELRRKKEMAEANLQKVPTIDSLAEDFIPDDYLEGIKTEYENPEITKKQIFNFLRKENQEFNKGVFKGIFEQGNLSGANKERLLGTQGEFASGGIASGPPPEKGPQSQGLAYLMKNGKR